MLKKLSFLIILFFATFLIYGCEKKSETLAANAAETLQVLNPTIRALPPGQKVTALYLQIKNDSESSYQLVSAQSDSSQFTEIHEHTNVDGVMKMGEVSFVDISAKSNVYFKPGGYHIMLINLKKELKLGDSADVVLMFNDGSKIKIKAEVKHIEVH